MLLIVRCFIVRILLYYNMCGVLMITKEFGQRLKEFRQETGLSQEKFALKISMDRTYYASVEAGRRNISLENIKKIADGFGVSLSQLFENL